MPKVDVVALLQTRCDELADVLRFLISEVSDYFHYDKTVDSLQSALSDARRVLASPVLAALAAQDGHGEGRSAAGGAEPRGETGPEVPGRP